MNRSLALDTTITQRVTLLSFGLLLGRASGFVREWVLARQYGTSAEADIFALALVYPEFVTALFSSVTVGALLYPLLQQAENYPRSEVNEVRKFLLWLAVPLFVILAGCVYARYSTDHAYLCVLFVSLLAIFPNVLSALYTAFLHYYGKAKVQASSTLIFNFAIIVGLLVSSSLAYAGIMVLCAACLRLSALYLEAKKALREPGQIHTDSSKNRLRYRAALSLLFLAALSQALPIAAPILDRLAASFGDVGDIAVLSYAEKLCMLPATLVLTILPYAAIPEMYRDAVKGSASSARATADKILMLSFVLGAGCAVIAYCFPLILCKLVFSYTGISPAGLLRIASGVQGYAWMLPFVGPYSVLSTQLLARGKQVELARCSLQMLTLKVILILLCGIYAFGPQFIGLSTGLAYAYGTGSLFRSIRERN